MAINAGLFSSNNSEWETPQNVFDILNEQYKFTLDAAASGKNAKCDWYFTKNNSCLTQPWCGRVFMNPPYGRYISDFVRMAYYEGKHNPDVEVVVCLLPARTDTRWWHEYCMNAERIGFIKGRLKFSNYGIAPFPSVVVVFRRGSRMTIVESLEFK